jgi:hypothetical protein
VKNKSAYHSANSIRAVDLYRQRRGRGKNHKIGFFSGANLLFLGAIAAIIAFVAGLVYAVSTTLSTIVGGG